MKNNGFRKELLVKLDDFKMVKVSKVFLKDLEENFLKFQKDYLVNKKALEKYVGQKDFIFESEKLSKKSPMAVINAPWGTGKTFFIENFLMLFIDEKLSSNIFKKMIIVDAWKFSSSLNASLEFVEQLGEKLVTALANDENKEVKKNLIKKIVERLVPDSIAFYLGVSGFLNVGATATYGVKKNNLNKNDASHKQDDKTREAWERMLENKVPTLIFIDNLERLGNKSWDLLKSILKLQEFENYLILLTMDLRKLSNNDEHKGSEYPINKYVDFNFYDFRQDYTGYFSKKFKDAEFISILNEVFNFDIDGEKLSIRQVEQACSNNNIFGMTNEYEILRKIRKEIWDAKPIFLSFFSKEILLFLTNEKLKQVQYNRIAIKILERDDFRNLINVSSWSGLENDAFSKNGIEINPFRLSLDYLESYKKWEMRIIDREKELKKEIKNLEKSVNVHSKKISEFKEKISQLNESFQKNSVQISIEATKQLEYNSKKHQELVTENQLLVEKIGKLEQNVYDEENEVNVIAEKVRKNQNTINKLFLSISDEIIRLEEINSNFKMSNEKQERIANLFKENFYEINNWLANNSSFDNIASTYSNSLLEN